MKTSLISVAAVSAVVALAGAAAAQSSREVGKNPYGGLHWSVVAPQGADWTLECGFAPVTIKGVHMNRINHTGSGRMAGRLPGDNGRCKVIKTGGEGPVGLAVVKDGEAKAAGTNGGAPAIVNIF